MRKNKRLAKTQARRGFRVRNQARRTGRPRLSVFRSNKHIYAQVIDDAEGKTLAAASTNEKELGGVGSAHADSEAAKSVGAAIAKRAVEKGVTQVVFDRGSYRYHGRVKALADAAREAGLDF